MLNPNFQFQILIKEQTKLLINSTNKLDCIHLTRSFEPNANICVFFILLV
jgi:hypothetical protein